jgi:serine phosphatase RsbU (regulator of sigma subunit)/pSer/pThr/pTyr-binding forkhead associated (FHA) protein
MALVDHFELRSLTFDFLLFTFYFLLFTFYFLLFMPELIVRYPDRAPEMFPLRRLRITIGRSARNDLCIPDPFASRVHVEVKPEGDTYILNDLGSANGTLYNGELLTAPIELTPGGKIQIGETVIIFEDKALRSSKSTMITEGMLSNPEATIMFSSQDRTTSGLLEAIEDARTRPSTAETKIAAVGIAPQSDLLALIGKVGVTLLGSDSLEKTLEQIAALVFDAVPAERCLIMMKSEEGNLETAVARLRKDDQEVDEIRVSRNIIEEVIGHGKSVLTADAQHDPRFSTGTVILQGIRSVLAVPLGVGEKIFGLIYADSPIANSKFTEDHLKVLTTLSSVAAIRVENARLLEERMERERLENELQLASEIQQRFQPSAPPKVEGFDLQGISFPCYEVGGDYYDFIHLNDGRLLIALGDVSGKGTAAALLMSSLHAAVHAQAETNLSVVNKINSINNYLADNTPANRFVTLFLAELNPQDGSINFVNAGHNPPVIVHSGGTTEQLGSGGLPLGIMSGFSYTEGKTQLHPGDVLVIYSDGVSEANNPTGDEFGVERLCEVVNKHLDKPANRLRDRIEDALSKFADNTPAGDDITFVIVKRQTTGASVTN